MRYLLATSAFSNPELLDKCIKSWPEWIDKMVHIDGYNPVPIFGEVLASNPTLPFSYAGSQRGCGGSWNWLLKQAFGEYDAVIVVGSDTEMKPGFLDRYISEFEERGLEFAVGQGHVCWNCWCITRRGYEAVGEFDLNLSPCYYEDNDYHTRVVRAGLTWDYIGDPTLMEHYGSATIRLDEHYNRANSETFSMNGAYYFKKWGGMPGAEVFEHPFNDPNLTVKDWQLNQEEYEIKRKLWSKC